MTTFICFMIAMVFLYVMRLFSGGFDLKELLSFVIMVVILGSHVYLCTRKKAILGCVVPIIILASFFPVYRIMAPVSSTTLMILLCLYMVAIGSCLYIWYKARKDNKS